MICLYKVSLTKVIFAYQMDINQLATLIIFILSISAALVYSYKIYKRAIQPTLSTWLIFCAATSMSLGSYLFTPNKQIFAAALNAADVFTDVLIIFTIIMFTESRWRLKPFEKYYLFGLIFISLFWFLTRNALYANLLVQVMLALAYFPTIHNILKNKVSHESFLGWGIIELSTLISLIPTFYVWQKHGNFLAFVYSARSFVFIAFLMVLMYMYRPRPVTQGLTKA